MIGFESRKQKSLMLCSIIIILSLPVLYRTNASESTSAEANFIHTASGSSNYEWMEGVFVDEEYYIEQKAVGFIQGTGTSLDPLMVNVSAAFSEVVFLNFSFDVRTTETEITISDETPEDGYQSAMAQAFSVEEDSVLTKITLGIYNQPQSRTASYEIREALDGETLHAGSISLTESSVNITISPAIELSEGKYFFWMDAPPRSNVHRWGHTTATNTSETYRWTGSAWISEEIDMIMSAWVSTPLNPESVDMKIEDNEVEDTAPGKGKTQTFALPITTDVIDLTISADTPIVFDYNCTLHLLRQAKATPSFTADNSNGILWNISVDVAPEPEGYNLTTLYHGLHETSYEIRAYFGEQGVSFTRLNETTLELREETEWIRFNTPNSIIDVNAPSEVVPHTPFSIDISADEEGIIGMEIYNPLGELCKSNISLDTNNVTVNLIINHTQPSGDYTIKVYHASEYKIGYRELTFTFIKSAYIAASNLTAYALSNIELDLAIRDLHSNQMLSAESVEYSLAGYSGVLEKEGEKYSQIVDGESMLLQGGEYSITYTAIVEGYQLIEHSADLIVDRRPIDIRYSRTSRTVEEERPIDIDFIISDALTQEALLLPVDLMVSIVPAGGDPNTDAVFQERIQRTIDGTTVTWNTGNAPLGNYDVLLSVISPYYEGEYIYESTIEIVPPLDLFVTGAVLVVGLGALSYIGVEIKKKQVKSSLREIMVINSNGLPLFQELSDPHGIDSALISGAIIGISQLVENITGTTLKKLTLEGLHLSISKRENFILVLIFEKDPFWVRRSIAEMEERIQTKYGRQIQEFKGQLFPMDINKIAHDLFGWEVERSERVLQGEREEIAE